MLNFGIDANLVESFHHTETFDGEPIDPGDTLGRAGMSVGFLEQARYEALDGSVDDHWDFNTVVYIPNSEKDPLIEVLSSRLTTEHAPSSTEEDMVLWRVKESAGATASFECQQQDLGSYALLKINIIGQIDDIEDPRMSSIEESSLNYMQNFRTQYCEAH
ncbi:hypothetical protein ACFC1B_19235 [Streptomyces xiamenensis]|uniref:hypothetical protein n=1 Tax=Streptomyces xiamenensis TaxID=408015 RepID=UPI0035E129EE